MSGDGKWDGWGECGGRTGWGGAEGVGDGKGECCGREEGGVGEGTLGVVVGRCGWGGWDGRFVRFFVHSFGGTMPRMKLKTKVMFECVYVHTVLPARLRDPRSTTEDFCHMFHRDQAVSIQ